MPWLFKSYNAEKLLAKHLLWNSLCLAHKVPQGSALVWFSRLIFTHFLSPTLLVDIIASFVLKHLYNAVSYVASLWMKYLFSPSIHTQQICGTTEEFWTLETSAF